MCAFKSVRWAIPEVTRPIVVLSGRVIVDSRLIRTTTCILTLVAIVVVRACIVVNRGLIHTSEDILFATWKACLITCKTARAVIILCGCIIVVCKHIHTSTCVLTLLTIVVVRIWVIVNRGLVHTSEDILGTFKSISWAISKVARSVVVQCL